MKDREDQDPLNYSHMMLNEVVKGSYDRNANSLQNCVVKSGWRHTEEWNETPP